MGLEVYESDWDGVRVVVKAFGRRVAESDVLREFILGGDGFELGEDFKGPSEIEDSDGFEGFLSLGADPDDDSEEKVTGGSRKKGDIIQQRIQRRRDVVRMHATIYSHVFPHVPPAIASRIIGSKLRLLVRSFGLAPTSLACVLNFLDIALRKKWEAFMEETDEEIGEETRGIRRRPLDLAEISEAISDAMDTLNSETPRYLFKIAQILCTSCDAARFSREKTRKRTGRRR